MNIRAISDLHLASPANRDALQELPFYPDDWLILAGDVAERFDHTRLAFAILTEKFAKVFWVPGNHDLYTPGAQRTDRIAKHFGPELHRQGPIHRLDIGGVTVLGLDPNRPTWVTASGMIPQDQLDALADALAEPTLADQFVVLALHYPVVGPDGAIYDNRRHGLLNAPALLAVLEAAPTRPQMVLHGHRHHGYRATLPVGEIPSFNCGSSGYAHMPDHDRAACMNLYTVEGRALTEVERFRYDGTAFQPEEGGAYATGR